MRLESLESRRLLTTFHVTRIDDVDGRACSESSCTLRDAIQEANANPGHDTITFAPELSGETLELTQVLTVTDSITIAGPGADQLTLSGRGTKQLFQFEGDGSQDFVLQDLTLANGRALIGPGGAVHFESGISSDQGTSDTLLLQDLVIRNSRAQGGGGVYAEGGVLTVVNTSFVNNTATGQTATTASDGAAILRIDGDGSITNSTVSNNEANGTAAAVSVVATTAGQSFQITSSSFVDNNARAIRVVADGADAVATTEANLFSGNSFNTLGTFEMGGGSATITSLGNNLSHDSAADWFSADTDQTNVDPLVAALDRTTFTHSLLPGSPAIDSQASIGGDIPAVDQLGNSRAMGTGIDIGAVEVAFDFGDAPTSELTGFDSSYPTLAADNGAYHVVAGPRLGATVDSERDGQPEGLSRGDQAFIDDEDGVAFIGGRYQSIGDPLTIAVDLQNAAATGNYLDAWVDWNRNGSWDDAGEQFAVSMNLGVADGSTIIELPLPDDFTPGAAHFRFRVSTAGGLTPAGMAADGEVEDYSLIFVPDDFQPIVDTLVDESDGDLSVGDISLREAIEYTNQFGGSAAIQIADSLAGETIDLTLGSLPIRRSTTINGPASGALTIDAAERSRIFDVESVDLALTDLNLTGGQTEPGEAGAAILFESSGELHIERSVITDNVADGPGGAISATGGRITIIDSILSDNQSAGDGAAVYASDGAELTIVRSSLNDNTAAGSGGAVAVDQSQLTILHSTIARNHSDQQGGGVYLSSRFGVGDGSEIIGTTISGNSATVAAGGLINDGGLLSIDSSTITNNQTAGLGDGLVSRGEQNTRTELRSSIVAGNGDSNLDVTGASDTRTNSLRSDGYNVFGPGNASDAAGDLDTSDVIDPLLAPLGFYGGAIEIHPLLQDSPALDAGRGSTTADRYDLDRDGDTSENIPVDARGVPRQIDLQGIDNRDDGVDAGAVEMIGLHLSDAAANETDGTLDFVAQLSHALPDGSTAELQALTLRGTAAPDVDYRSLWSVPVSLTASGDLSTTVSVELIDDALIENDEQFELLLTTTPDVILTRDRATGTIVSDDVAGLLLSKTSLVASESGRADSLSVALTAQPLEDVVIDLGLDRDDEIQLDRQQLVFTPDNWNLPQTVVVTAKNDQRIDGSQITQLTLAIGTSSDPQFVSLSPQSVAITTTDNDVAGITVEPLRMLQTTEAGKTATFTIRLDALPASDVTIALSSSNLHEATIDTPTLRFTPENGTTPQTVTITGVDDSLIDGNVELTIVIAAAASDDPNFDGLNAADVELINLDDERLDYGDAPDSIYPTSLESDGARHGASDLFLGDGINFEPFAIANPAADSDLDDGVHPITSFVAASDSDSVASVIVVSSGEGRLDAWIDFNQDGDWDDPGEQIAAALPLNSGENIVPVTIPAGASSGGSFARFRLSSSGGLSPTGQAGDGEVEDYQFHIVSADDAPSVFINTVNHSTQVDIIDGQTVVRSGEMELFRAPLPPGSAIDFQFTSGDDYFDTADLWSLGIDVWIDTQMGTDTIRFRPGEGNFDIGDLEGDLGNIEAIDLTGNGSQSVLISPTSVLEMAGSDDSLKLFLDPDDVFASMDQWTLVGNVPIDGQYYEEWQGAGAATLLVNYDGNNGWTYGSDPLDVNASGEITALDALIIINELSRRQFVDDDNRLVDRATLDEFPGFFYDTNRDGHLSPIDALIILNALSRVDTNLASEQPIAYASAADLEKLRKARSTVSEELQTLDAIGLDRDSR
ncbi:GEVED domain-containing protein [Rosistilla oblonga]|uniref:GEVED domain-containing protein n=1 Tax=Rosistilla oblonga TaxID=2527990 RepID=UPI003A96CF05